MPSPFTHIALLFVIGNAVVSLPIEPRLTLAEEWTSYHKTDPNGPGTYAFGYDLEDPATGNIQFRQEEKYGNGTVAGSYGYVDPEGIVRITHYVADDLGYRTRQEGSSMKSVRFPPDENNDLYSNSVENPSPQMASAIQSSLNSGRPVYEQRTPPKYNPNYYDASYNVDWSQY